MKLIFPSSTNPFFASNAISNRYESLLTGLLKLGVRIHLIVVDGCVVENENKKSKELMDKFSNLQIEYLVNISLKNKNTFRLKKYLFDYFLIPFTINILKKRFESLEGFIFLTGNISVRKAYLNSSISIQKRGIIEFSEFQNIENTSSNRISLLQKNTEFQYSQVTSRVIKKVPNFLIMTKVLIPYYLKLSSNPSAKFLHLPMTVNLERFQETKDKLPEFVQPYISFVGVLNDVKDGVSILIKAFNEIKDKFPEHKVYLVGPWQYDTPAQLDLIEKLGLSQSVFWMKEYSRDQIPNIICNADLLVLPRPDSKQAQGGFPTKLGEYLATGKPVCATRVGEIPDYLSDNESVFFAEPGSVESFAEAMERALGDYENAKRVGANGRKVAEEHFNKDVQARKLMWFLEELVGEEPSQK